MAEENEQIHVNADEARAGATPGITRYILAISMVLIIVVFAVLLML